MENPAIVALAIIIFIPSLSHAKTIFHPEPATFEQKKMLEAGRAELCDMNSINMARFVVKKRLAGVPDENIVSAANEKIDYVFKYDQNAEESNAKWSAHAQNKIMRTVLLDVFNEKNDPDAAARRAQKLCSRLFSDNEETFLSAIQAKALNEKKTPGVVTGIIKVEAADMYDEHQENKIAAEQKYKGRPMIISGNIYGFDKALDDIPFITFQSQTKALGQRMESGGVAAYLSPAAIPMVAAMKRGQRVSLQCTGVDSFRVKDCTVASALKENSKAKSNACEQEAEIVRLLAKYVDSPENNLDALSAAYQYNALLRNNYNRSVDTQAVMRDLGAGKRTAAGAFDRCMAE